MSASLRFPARRVCLVLHAGIGDVVNALPVANALRDDDPERHITWVVGPAPAPLLRSHRAADEVVVFHREEGLRGVRRLWREMRGRHFDLTLNLHYFLKSAIPTLFSGAPHRVGMDWARSRDGVWFAANHHIPAHPQGHVVETNLHFLRYLGLDAARARWAMEFTEAEQRAQDAFFDQFGRPVATLVPASAQPAKDWLPERFAAVADALHHDLGYQIILAGGPGERENLVAREIVARSRAVITTAMGDDLRRLAWIVHGSDLVIAPDTGPVHIARALEVPVIGLYGHTNPWRVGPWRMYQDLWVDRYTDADEAPDPARREPRDGRMERITVRDVLERVERARECYPRAVG